MSVDLAVQAPLRPTPTGPLLFGPYDAAYAESRPWNRAVVSAPRAVVRAHTAAEVAAAVTFAGACGLRVAVRSTGHGAVPIDRSTLLVHTGAMTECTIQPERRWARIGAGVRWQQVLDAAASHGLAPVCGSAPGIGAVGFLTGGGLGPVARTLGVSADHVRALEVVTGTGRMLRATPTEHPELFWGLRGGKATLGIVTAVEIDLLPIREFYAGALWFDSGDARAVLRAWRRLCAELPEAGTTSAAMLKLPPLEQLPPAIAGRQTLAIRFAWLGDEDDGRVFVDRLRAVATPVLDDVRVRPYTEIGAVHCDPVDPAPIVQRSALLSAFPDEAVDALLRTVERQDNALSVVEVRLLGGAVGRAHRQASAFCHRDAAFSLFVAGVAVPDGRVVGSQADRVIAAFGPWATAGLLANFAADDDPAVVRRYYDKETFDRLAALADRYDPHGVLDVGQVARLRPAL